MTDWMSCFPEAGTTILTAVLMDSSINIYSVSLLVTGLPLTSTMTHQTCLYTSLKVFIFPWTSGSLNVSSVSSFDQLIGSLALFNDRIQDPGWLDDDWFKAPYNAYGSHLMPHWIPIMLGVKQGQFISVDKLMCSCYHSPKEATWIWEAWNGLRAFCYVIGLDVQVRGLR